MDHSMIYHAPTLQTVDLQAISTRICKLPPSPTLLSANCKQKYTQFIYYTKCPQSIVSERSQLSRACFWLHSNTLSTQANNQYLLTSASTYFLAPQPGPGGFCIAGPLNATTSKSSNCYVTATASNCASLNNNYAAKLCLKGDCSSSSTSITVTTPTAGGSSCSNVLTGMTIAYTIGTSGTSYVLSSVTITPTYSTVTYGSTVVASLSVTVSSPASSSGNPGYRLDKPITISPSIFALGDPTTGACYTTSTGSTLSLLFGQSATYSCISASPCSTSYYIDSLIKSSISIQKYASQATDTITVSGTSSGTNGCSYESYNLQILYSYSGWSLDPQYYVVGASLSGQTSADNTTNPYKKYLSVSWLYTDPQSLSTPPSNFFYTYFSYLWTPLKQKFGLS